MTIRRQRMRSGYLVAEIAIGVAVLAALAVSLTVMVSRHSAASAMLADRRAAVRIAEEVLLSLQSEHVAPPKDNDAAITTRRLDGSEPPAGRQWVEVQVEVNGQLATLYGLAATDRLDGVPEVAP